MSMLSSPLLVACVAALAACAVAAAPSRGETPAAASSGAPAPASGSAAPAGKVALTPQSLDRWLSRAVTHIGLLATSPEPPTPTFDEDLAMLVDMGTRFVGRAAYQWNVAADDEAFFRLVAERAARVHAAAPDMVLQACVFETTYPDVSRIRVPAWALEEFGLPAEDRGFRYDDMIYADGTFHGRWGRKGSVPDMGRPETRLWFYTRARQYIDAGCEAIHFGQYDLMCARPGGREAWADMLARVRAYAARRARRGFVLADAHVLAEHAPESITSGGRLLFDFLSYPLRPEEGDRPLEARLVVGHMHAIYGRSPGGVTPGGWRTEHLPYLAEFDNFGASGKPGQNIGGIWIWGYDECSWLAAMTPDARAAWLRYAYAWLAEHDPAARLQFCTRRPVTTDRGHEVWNDRTQAPIIKALWAATP